MKNTMLFFRLLNTLSIDVALGAMAGAAFFAAVLDVNLRPAGLLSLGLTVWIIYTVDHLSDARQITSPASSERHRYHQRNFLQMTLIVTAALLADFVLIFFIRKPVLISGLVLSSVVMTYLLFQRRIRYVKEFIIAILYTCGILLPALSLNTNPISLPLALLFFQFGMTALINLLLFSQIERGSDLRDNQHSLVTDAGKELSARVITIAFLIQVLVAIPLVLSNDFRSTEAVLLCMNLVLALISLFPTAFTRNNGYRLAGDAVFLIPVIYFFIR